MWRELFIRLRRHGGNKRFQRFVTKDLLQGRGMQIVNLILISFFLLVTRLKYMTLDIVELGLSALSRIESICNNAGVPMASLILLLYRPCSTHKYVELKRD